MNLIYSLTTYRCTLSEKYQKSKPILQFINCTFCSAYNTSRFYWTNEIVLFHFGPGRWIKLEFEFKAK